MSAQGTIDALTRQVQTYQNALNNPQISESNKERLRNAITLTQQRINSLKQSEIVETPKNEIVEGTLPDGTPTRSKPIITNETPMRMPIVPSIPETQKQEIPTVGSIPEPQPTMDLPPQDTEQEGPPVIAAGPAGSMVEPPVGSAADFGLENKIEIQEEETIEQPTTKPQGSATPSIPQIESKIAGFDRQTKAAEDMTQAGVDLLEAEQEGRRLSNVALEANKKEILKQRERQAEAAQNVLDDLATSADDIKNFKVDSNRWWNDKSTGQKAMTVIGALLGAYSSGMNLEKGNRGLDLIDAEIKRDLAAQKAEHDAKKKGYDAQNNLYAQMRKKFKSDDEAMLAAQAIQLERVKNKTIDLTTKAKSAQVRAKGEAAIGQIEAKQAQVTEQLKNARIKAMGDIVKARVTGNEKLNKAEREFRQEYDKHPTIVNLRKTQVPFETIQNAPDNPIGDSLMIFTIFKQLDPTSTVREGEFEMMKKSTSIPDSLKNIIDSAISGRKLTPQQREYIRDISKQKFASARQSALAYSSQFLPKLRAAGVRPTQVLDQSLFSTRTQTDAPIQNPQGVGFKPR